MPEMSGDYSLKVYKAVAFPDKWEITDVVLSDVFACDSVFIETESKRFLLTNEMYHNVPNGQYASCWVKNYLYEMDGLRVTSDGVKVAYGDFGIRNAGKTFLYNGKLCRIGQDCRERMYGRGMVLFEIESIKPYKERVIDNWECHDLVHHIQREVKTDIIGTHTYNFTENYEIIDFSTISEVSTYVIRERKKRRYLKILKRIKNRFF